MPTTSTRRSMRRYIKREGVTADIKRKSRTDDGAGGFTEGLATIEEDTPVVLTKIEGQEREVMVGESETAFVDHDGMVLPEIDIEQRDVIVANNKEYIVKSIGNANSNSSYTDCKLEEKQRSE